MATCGCFCGNRRWLVAALVAMAVGGCDAGGPASERQAAPRAIIDADAADQPTAANPVIWSAVIVPRMATAGSKVDVEIRGRMAAGWMIHPVHASPGPASPTTLQLELPPGVEAVGDWELPPTRRPLDKLGSGAVYEGDVTFRRTLRIADGQPPGKLEIGCEVGFQACDANSCRRPEKVLLVGMVCVVD